MNTSLPQHYGFVIRRYECDADMMDYAQIDCPFCGSVDDVIEEVISYLKGYLKESDEKPLSKKAWKSVEERIDNMATFEGWTIKPNTFDEFEGRILPISIKVDYIALSDEHVRLVKKNPTPGSGAILHVFEYDAFMGLFRGCSNDGQTRSPEYLNAREALNQDGTVHLFRKGIPYVYLKKTKTGYVECPYEPAAVSPKREPKKPAPSKRGRK